MTTTQEAVASLDWTSIAAHLDQEGYAILPGLISDRQARDLTGLIVSGDVARASSEVPAPSGHGELFWLPQAAPSFVDDLRASFYQHLVPIANRWSDALGIFPRYPAKLEAFVAENRRAGQVRPQSHLSCLREGDYQELHQRSCADPVFPLQLVGLLSEPGEDFAGGELVMTEQRPRMQSRPMVLPLRRGDLAIITVAQRPQKGTKGHYRVNLKHAISRVRRGARVGLELLLHDAR